MKKLIVFLFCLFPFFAFAQDEVPSDSAYHSLPTYSFRYYTADSSVWIYKGSKYKTTKLARAKDGWYAKALSGTDTVYIHVEAKDTLNIAKYMLHNDSTDITGYATRGYVQRNFVAINDSSKYYKFKIDSTATDGYTRRDRLSTELFKKVDKTLTITATAPITIAGTTSADLSTNRTIAIIPSTPSVAGSMSAADKVKVDSLTANFALYERLANKSTSVTTDGASDIKYASSKSVKTYADAKVADAINDGTTTIAPSQNAVFDALAGKQATLTNPYTGTGSAGQVAFHTGTSTLSGDNGLFWDNTNKRLSLGSVSPGYIFSINTITASDQAIRAVNSATSGDNYGGVFIANGTGASYNSAGYFYASGATENKSIIISGTEAGTSNYALYSSAAAKSYMAGSLSIGDVNAPHKFTLVDNVSNKWISFFQNTFTTAGQNYGVKINAGSNSSDVAFYVGDKNNNDLFDVYGDGSVSIAGATGYKFATNGTGYFSGNLTANAFIKIGGTSAQYLLADGSVTTFSGAVYKDEVDGDDGLPRKGGSALIDGTGTTGWFYACYDTGTYDYGNPNGNSITLAIGDQIYYNGTIWIKIPGAGSYTLPIALTTALGGVISNGNVSVNASTGGMTVVTNANLTGDVTSSGNATTIANDAVTYAKMQNVSATDKVLGRVTAGAGDVEEISTTGSGNIVRATDATLVNPALGTPASGVATNLTGTAASLNIGGNAATATILATTRAINGVDFNGSAAISVPSNIAAGTSGNVMTSNGSVWTSAAIPTLNQNTTGSAGLTVAALTFSSSGDGAAATTTFNGSTARTISYNSIGAQVAGSYQAAGTYSTNIHANITALNAVTNTNTGDNATNTRYSGLVTNATHSGDATGSGALTLATVNSNVGTYQGLTVNAKGLVTAAANQNYLTAESDPTVNNATLTMAVAAGGGLSISATPTFTANASAGKTITVTSNATATNTASTIVLRDGSGNVSLTGTFCSSDSTLKKNIRPFSKTDLYNASKIDFRKFLFKTDSENHLHFGVVAQEVEKLIPEVVSTNELGKLEVNYTEMLVLIAAQHAEEIRLLKEQNGQLEKRISKLERKNRWTRQQMIIQ